MNDALKLYRNLNDSKAVGVASNNLANALLELVRNAKGVDECCSIFPGVCIAQEAIRHYDEAIRIAEHDVQLVPDDQDKTALYQQLADRLFNKALFLLIVTGKHCAPADSHEVALACLAYVRQLDNDIKASWLKCDIFSEHVPEMFTRALKRCVGLLDFYHDKEVRSIWDPKELVKECDQLLNAEMSNAGSELFVEVSPVGRLQQLLSVWPCNWLLVGAARKKQVVLPCESLWKTSTY
jgi:tetratricopeptide (TPR) repeat protein